MGDYLLNRGFYTPHQVAQLLGCTVAEVKAAVNEVTVPALNGVHAIDRVSAMEQNVYMQSQLLKDTDYMSMWHSIEVRVPFLDKQLLQTIHAIDPAIKYNPAVKKYILIKAFEDILPREIYQRQKQGFTFPFENWINKVKTTTENDPAYQRLYTALNSGKLQWSRYWAYMLAKHGENIVIR